VRFARCCTTHGLALIEDAEGDTLTCVVTGRPAVRWYVVDVETGKRLALVTRFGGAIAVSEQAASFDAEAMLADTLDRDRDGHVPDGAPSAVPCSESQFMTSG
jgi:hypothetical protein